MFEIKDIKPRIYQETILATATKKNTLVVLPTGMGKSMIFLLTAISRLNSFPNSKVLILSPTKPLCSQHKKTIEKYSNIANIELFTGTVSPAKREELWKGARIIIATPQTIEADIINERINLEDVSLIVFDECHRAVQNYSYTWISKQYHKKAKYPRILGLTASPGSKEEVIKEVIKNLFIEEIEIRTEESPDVKPYIKDVDITQIKVDLPEEFKEVKDFLDGCLKTKLQTLKEMGIVNNINLTKKELLGIQGTLQGRLIRGERDFQIMRAISIVAEIIKVEHALGLIETQGSHALYSYMKNLYEGAEKTKVKATKNLVKDLNFHSAYIKTQILVREGIEHSKISELKKIVNEEISKDDKMKIMVFTQYRDTASFLEKELNKISKTKAKIFVGQAKKADTGLTQKEQLKIIEDFTNHHYNVIISSSVGEEGLDIPQIDLVIFFEPIPSAIRSIQRRGRTARLEKGRVIVLMTKNSRDEMYYWIAYHKEKRMKDILINLKQRMGGELKTPQSTLKSFSEEKRLKVFADSREKNSTILKELINQKVSVETKNLDVADYIISERVGIERKEIGDFINSIIDKRLLTQIKNLKDNFSNPILILEGEEDIYSVRNIHPNAIRGMLATIAIDFGIPIIRTKNQIDTASLIKVIANREQNSEKREVGVRFDKKPLTTKEQQEFIIESLPGIGPSLAKSLLKEFKSVKNVINAHPEKMQNVEKMGPKKTQEISRVLEESYGGD